ncbi:MAG: tetratricopeptide repeat protein [Pseudomonadota bacterium]
MLDWLRKRAEAAQRRLAAAPGRDLPPGAASPPASGEAAARIATPTPAAVPDRPAHAAALAAGRPAEAQALAQRAVESAPDDIEAWVTIARVAVDRRRAADARRAIERLRALPAAGGRADWLAGLLEHQAGRREAAEAAYRTALGIDPMLADARFQLARLQREAGRWEEAIDSCRAAVAADPLHAEAQADLGAMLRDRGQGDAALPHLRAAVDADPRLARAWFNLALAQIDAAQWAPAAQSLERLVALEPRQAEAHHWLGHARMALGEPDAARAAYAAALAADAGFLRARWALAMAQIDPVPGSLQAEATSRAAFAQALERLTTWMRTRAPADAFEAVAVAQPFYLAYQDENPRELLAQYGRLCATAMAAWARKAGLGAPPAVAPGRRPLRVGIVSAHLHDHSVWNAIVRGWVEHADRSRVEFHLFALGGHEDDETAFARRRAAGFHRLGAWPDAARALAAARLDAVIYPEIGMHTATAKLAALRLAPLQLASWGHPVTTGLPTIDVYIGAEALEPADADAHYTERLERLPRLGCTPRRYGVAPERIDLVGAGLQAGERVLLCPGNPFKYGPAHDPLWVEVARRSPQGRLVFFRGGPEGLADRFERRLRVAFEAAGLEFHAKVSMQPWQSRARFFGWLAAADVFLDSAGFSGFNTVMQAVECGTPIVTLEGPSMRTRFGAGVLRQLGLGEWVASDAAGYAERVARLVGDAALRADVSARLRSGSRVLFEDRAASTACVDLLERLAAAPPAR